VTHARYFPSLYVVPSRVQLCSHKDNTMSSIDHATADLGAIDQIEVGEEAAKHFLFQNGYRNLNHGII
jgi:hypothetical protein